MARHGWGKTRIYGIWCSIKRRCNTPSAGNYARYGGAGVRVCEEWSISFIAFRDWALANGYEEGLSIDRRESGGNYEPSNCRWTDRNGQSRNMRKRRGEMSSKYKGVCWDKYAGKWRARIQGSGAAGRNLGLFKSEVESALAYDAAARELFGEFAAVNFPDGAESACLIKEDR